MTDFSFFGRHRLAFVLNAILPKRKFPLPYKVYGGPCASYWSLSMEAAHYVFEFIHYNKRLQNFFKFTWAPDEFLVNTIIMNSHLKDTVINNNFRYIDWTLGGAHPKILTIEDFTLIKKSNTLFARKFDTYVDNEILALIDREILAN